MRCPSCGHENREDASFCKGCGATLARSCPACGAEQEPDAAFCDRCGARLSEPERPAAAAANPRSYTPPHLAEKILRERAGLEGERRTVTVLFSDAVGFTPLSESLGEERVYELVQECTRRMVDAVHRYEGTVTQFGGDGVVALFGAPIAHEDAARRAVAAALEMQRALHEYAAELKHDHPNIECQFRVGLNTGPVVVGKISDNLDMDYTAIGDTVNLASRLEGLAEPGTVCLSESTKRAAQDYFDCEPLGELDVKGKAEPVVAYKALRETSVRTRFEAAVERGLTPFVGREQELAVLRGFLEQAKRGQGQVVFVSGDAGIGKTRLLQEFRAVIQDEGVAGLEGGCSEIGKVPYLPVIEILKHSFDVQEGDNDAAIIEKVDGSTASWDKAALATVPYLKYLLNVDPGDPAVAAMDPMERRAGILDGLRALLLQESRQRPVAVLVEDLHWIDEKSEEALAALVDVIASAPVLLILSYRPGYTHSLGERTYYSRLALGHLPPEDGATMAEHVLGVAEVSSQLQQLVTSKAEGNPLFIEEVIKSLLGTGALRKTNGTYSLEVRAEDIAVPDTLEEVILSRIDRLHHEAKHAIQLASVIGRDFTVRLLDRISDVEVRLEDVLGELKALELIREKAYFPELSYMFKHALTHQVARSTLLVERRKALHCVVAAAIEELYADRLPEHYEMLALHYYEGQQWEKALDYLVKAADKTAAAFANQEALDYYASALEVCGRLGDSTLETAASVAKSRAFVNFTTGDMPAGIADFERMLAAARGLGDRRLEGIALAYRGLFENEEHDFEKAEGTLQGALALGREVGDNETVFMSQVALTELFHVTSRHAEAEAMTAAAEELAPVASDAVALGYWGLFHSISANWAGSFDDAIHRVQGVWRSTAGRMAAMAVFADWCEALAMGGRGDYDAALQALRDIVSTCERIGEVQVRARTLNTIGWICCELQDHLNAIEWNERGVEAAIEQNRPDPEFENNARLNLGDSLMALGRLDEAEEQFKMVEDAARNPRPQDRWMLWRYSQHLFHSYGELWLARGDYERALAYADECLVLAEESDSKKNVVKGRRLRGQALLAQGKLDEAQQELSAALEIAKEIGNPPQLWKTHAAIGALRLARGRTEDAGEAYGEALAVIDGVAGGLTDEALRKTFLSSEHVRKIQARAKQE